MVSPVRNVSMLSTGTVEIHPEHVCGTSKPLLFWLLTSRKWLPPRPIGVYVIEHEDGLVLFDTGQDRASITDPNYFPGFPLRIIYERLARFHIEPHDTLTKQLETLGHDPRDVRVAVFSHLHQDHIGGIRELSGAELVVAQADWDELSKPLPEAAGFLRKHIDLPGLRWRKVGFESTDDEELRPFTEAYDLLGDDALVLLPTPGHTPGSLSMFVRRERGAPLLMVGDLTYDAALLDEGAIPGVGVKSQLRAASDRVRALKQRVPELVVLPAHDPAAQSQLAAANAA